MSFKIHLLSRDAQEDLIRRAHSICEKWWFDKLDCSESLCRQLVKDVSFEDAMKHFVDGALASCITRDNGIVEPYLEVGFRSMESPVDYFLWIVVPLDRKDECLPKEINHE